jgi:hypothetical protein
MPIASGNRSALRSPNRTEWNAPSEQPTVAMSTAPPQSPWIDGTTSFRIHDSYRWCSCARCSSGTSLLDQDAASCESTQYSFALPSSSSGRTASIIPFDSKSHARPCSEGNTRNGRP